MTTVAKSMKRPPTKKGVVKTPEAKRAVAKSALPAKSAPAKAIPAKPVAIKPVAIKPVAFKPVAFKVVAAKPVAVKTSANGYALEDQIGFRLRRAHQRASVIFNEAMGRFDVTPTQFAALAKLDDLGIVSQNQLGRATAMDPATILGVVGRLVRQGLIRTRPDPIDGRQMLLELTPEGKVQVVAMKVTATTVSKRTLVSLKPDESETLLRLLAKIG